MSDLELDSLTTLGLDDCLGGGKAQQINLDNLLLSIKFENSDDVKRNQDTEINKLTNSCESFTVELARNARGFGFAIIKKDGRFYIKDKLREPALSEAHMKAGDQILSVNDFDISSLTHTEAVDFLRAQPKAIKLILKSVDILEPNLSNEEFLESVKPDPPSIKKDELEDEFNRAKCSNLSNTSQSQQKRLSNSDSFDDEDSCELDLSGKYYKSLSRNSSRSSPSVSTPNTVGKLSNSSSRIRSQLRAEALMFVLEKASKRQSGTSSTPSRKLNRSHKHSKQDLSESGSQAPNTSIKTDDS